MVTLRFLPMHKSEHPIIRPLPPPRWPGFFGRTSRAVFGQLFVRAKGLFACADTVSAFGRDKSAKSSRESSDRLDLYLLRCK